MAPSGWATDTEKAFLFLQLPDYVKRVAAGKLHLFWGSVVEGFLQKFPERAKLGLPNATEIGKDTGLTPEQRVRLDLAITARRKQIETWFRYQKKKLDNKSNIPAPSNAPSLARILFSAPVRRRGHQAIEVFQTRHAAEIREALADAGYDDLTADDAPSGGSDVGEDTAEARLKRLKSVRMRFRSRVVRQMFDNLNEEEKASIEEQLEEEKKTLLDEAAEKDKDEKTPAGLQMAIDELPGAIAKVLNIAQKESGWVAMTIIGGPNPRMQGELSVKVICTGETPAGNNFETAFPNFDNVIIEQFYDFLRAVFPADMRAARALTEDPDVAMEDCPNPDDAPDQDNESAPPKATKAAKKNARAKKDLAPTTTPAPVGAVESTLSAPAVVATSGLHLPEMMLDATDSTPIDSDDPFMSQDSEPFPGACSDTFAALELGTWSWADFVAGKSQSSSNGHTGSMYTFPPPSQSPDGSQRILSPTPWRPVSSPPMPSLAPAAAASSIGSTPSAPSTPWQPVSSPVSSPPASCSPPALGAASSSIHPEPTAVSPPPPSWGLPQQPSIPFAQPVSHPIRFIDKQGDQGALDKLFRAFKNNSDSVSVALQQGKFSFSSTSSSLRPPASTIPGPSFARGSLPSSSLPTSSLPLVSPLPTLVPSGMVLPRRLTSSVASTPTRQTPTRAAQALTSFLSPERRPGSSSASSHASTGPLPAPEKAAEMPGSSAGAGGGPKAPALPKSRPAAKQPVRKAARTAPNRGAGRKAAAKNTPVAVAGPDVLGDATNTVVPASMATVNAMDSAADTAPPIIDASDINDTAPGQRKPRERRAPKLADGTAATRVIKRTRDEMRALKETEFGKRAALEEASGAANKRRKTSA
ncbi:hypothetical protein C8J57DRAFT_1713064 [Mycena rebaudengoi]|nr:hypothetical protein C8J57DRAFT_1713064 [Mycena rebaudengoi]